MPALLDLTNQQFGQLTALYRVKNHGGRVAWHCKCTCGRECDVRGYSLTSSHTVSCGCVAAERLADYRLKHGQARTRAYKIWVGMKGRCFNPDNTSYVDYGGRGITVCERWLKFENFLADMGHPPSNTSIDRINNDGNYKPGNCRWATPSEQLNNRRNNVKVEYQGRTQTLTEWAEELGFNVDTLYARIVRYRWDINDAMTRSVATKDQQPCIICGEKHFAKNLCNRCYSREYARRSRRAKALID